MDTTLTEEESHFLVRALAGILPDRWIARLTGYTHESVRKIRKKKGLPPAPVRITELDENVSLSEEIAKDPELSFVSDEEIAEKYEVTSSYVAMVRRKKKLPSYKQRMKDEHEEVLQEWAGRITDEEVADLAKVHLSTVIRYRQINGIPAAARR